MAYNEIAILFYCCFSFMQPGPSLCVLVHIPTQKRLKLGMVYHHLTYITVERATTKTRCTSCTNWTIEVSDEKPDPTAHKPDRTTHKHLKETHAPCASS